MSSHRIARTGLIIDSLLRKGDNGYTAGIGIERTDNVISMNKAWLVQRIRAAMNEIQPAAISVTDFSILTSLDLTSIGSTQQIMVTNITPSNATNKAIYFSSDNTSVASVSNDGVVTANGEGDANITVICGTVSKICKVSVALPKVAVESITLSESSKTVKVGETFTLTTSVLPENASDKSVVWTSSDNSYASVSKGVVTALKEGNTTITATCGGKTATCAVTVEASSIEVPVTAISLNKSTLILSAGESASLIPTVTPTNATDRNNIKWTSSNTSVAKISSNAGTTTVTITGSNSLTSDSTAIITATLDGFTAQCTVSVSAAVIATKGVSLNSSSLSLTSGGTGVLTATVSPANATNKNNVQWTTSNSSVVSLSSTSGTSVTITGASNLAVETTATITASLDGYSATCEVKVAGEDVYIVAPVLVGEIAYETSTPSDTLQTAVNYGAGSLTQYTSFGSSVKTSGATYTYNIIMIPDSDIYSTRKGYYVDSGTDTEFVANNVTIAGDYVTYQGTRYRVYARYNKMTGVSYELKVK